jgi:hypothetical protein
VLKDHNPLGLEQTSRARAELQLPLVAGCQGRRSPKMGCQNKKRTRVILIVTGIILIAIGILAGQLIVRNMKTKVDENNCITSKDDEKYKTWVSKS